METWIEKQDKLRLWQDLKISAGDQVYALGRLESCVIFPDKQKIGKLSDIEMPTDCVCDESVDIGSFARMKRDPGGMEYVYSHRVRYSDLDKSRHMANLRYVNLMENVFSPEFYECHSLKELELHYISQSFYDDEIRIYKMGIEHGYLIAGYRADETIIFSGSMLFEG